MQLLPDSDSDSDGDGRDEEDDESEPYDGRYWVTCAVLRVTCDV
jgi:hypothetical protein